MKCVKGLDLSGSFRVKFHIFKQLIIVLEHTHKNGKDILKNKILHKDLIRAFLWIKECYLDRTFCISYSFLDLGTGVLIYHCWPNGINHVTNFELRMSLSLCTSLNEAYRPPGSSSAKCMSLKPIGPESKRMVYFAFSATAHRLN